MGISVAATLTDKAAMLIADHIHKTYSSTKKHMFSRATVNKIDVLQDVSLDVRDGEFVSILGPSGCGKSTLLKIFAGLIALDSGRLTVEERPVTGPNSSVAVVFQHVGLLPWRTVRKNIELAIELRNHAAVTAEEGVQVEKYIAMVGLAGFEDHYPHQLSGGMQQRVGLARALVTNPKILLLDEPFGALDAQTRLLLQEELLRLWSQNRITTLLVTHDIEEAVYLSDRVFLMTRRPGKIKMVTGIDLKRPRYAYDVRSHPRFAELKKLLWESIKEENVMA